MSKKIRGILSNQNTAPVFKTFVNDKVEGTDKTYAASNYSEDRVRKRGRSAKVYDQSSDVKGIMPLGVSSRNGFKVKNNIGTNYRNGFTTLTNRKIGVFSKE